LRNPLPFFFHLHWTPPCKINPNPYLGWNPLLHEIVVQIHPDLWNNLRKANPWMSCLIVHEIAFLALKDHCEWRWLVATNSYAFWVTWPNER
jgi:hypothetical protein